MKFRPQFSTKLLSQTKPGELIRLEWNVAAIAIAARIEEQSALIFLDPIDEGQIGPAFMPSNDETNVISYGKDYVLSILHEHRFMDMSGSKLPMLPGSIFVSHAGKRLLCTQPCKGINFRGRMYFDIETGLRVNRDPLDQGVYFGSWEIRLADEGGKSGLGMRMYSFQMPEQ
jgi:hypothetical protein